MRRLTLLTMAISLLLMLFTAIPVLAEPEESEETEFLPELFLTDDAYAPEKGELGIWFQPEYYNDDEGTLTLINLSIEYGITDHLLFEASFEGYKQIDPEDAGESTESGTGDVSFGLMYAIGDEDAKTHLAVGLEVTLPTGDYDKDLTEGYRVYEPFIAVSHDLASGASLHANLSYGIVDQRKRVAGEVKQEENEVGIAVAYVHPLGDSMAFMFEATTESNKWLADGEDTEEMAGPALVWQSESGIQAGMEALVGLSEDSADWAVLINIGKEFELGDHD